jgi:predicted heme/steroid binding protein/uncharacterized membrane protein
MKEYTEDDLKQFDGKQGRPAYVVKDGKVYDVSGSSMWGGGEHVGRHGAGQDLSGVFGLAPHGDEVLDRVKLVGVLKEKSTASEKDAAAASTDESKPGPQWAQMIVRLHAHPISVHFPQAFLSFAPFFLLLFYVTGNRHFERTGYYMMVTAALTSIPAFCTGIVHWVHKYGRSPAGIFKFKIVMSLVLVLLSLVTAGLHTACGPLEQSPLNGALALLYVLLVPIGGAVGHAGGKIVFGPSKK